MAIRAGQILHLANDAFLIDRIQSVAANVNVPRDRVYELGNYFSLGNIRDLPDLGFTVESYDVTWELPAILNNITLGTVPVAPNNFLDPAASIPIDITSPFKTKRSLDATTGVSTAIQGVSIPFLFLESLSMRFGVTALSSITYGFRGDSIYYSPGVPLVSTQTGIATPSTLYSFKNGATATTAVAYPENGVDKFAQNVTVIYADGSYKRLTPILDYTETATGVTLVASGTLTTSDKIRLVFAAASGGAAPTGSYKEAAPATPLVHEPVAGATPAALRGRFMVLYVNGIKFTRVQDASIDWSVSLERDEEFNNPRVLDMTTSETPNVSGAFTLKVRDPAEFIAKIQTACNVTSTKAVGPIYDSTSAVPVELRMLNPLTGATISSVYMPLVTFDIPGYDQRVPGNNMMGLNFYSEDGIMRLYKGNGPTP